MSEDTEAPTTRCHAAKGTVYTGPQFCGYKASGVDENGRPCCRIHLGKQVTIAWYGDRYRYPEGTGGRWEFRHGAPRSGGSSSDGAA